MVMKMWRNWHSYIVGGMQKQFGHYRKQFDCPLKIVKYRITIWSCNSTPRHFLQQIETQQKQVNIWEYL